MSLKEISELLKDLIESNKQLTLRLKMILIQKFLEKQKMKEKNLYDLEENLESKDIRMKFLQRSLHSIRKRAWKHKRSLFHMNKAIKEMELVYENTSHPYETLIFSINEMKRYRAQEYFEYQNALSILKNYRVFTA